MTSSGDMAIPSRFPIPGAVAGKSVVITGSSRGLGRVLAIAFASAGAQVGLVGRSKESLEAVLSELPTGNHRYYVGDVRDEDFNEAVAHGAIESNGRLDAWIANAGISPTVQAAHSLPTAAWDAVLQTNLTGAFLGARCAARAMSDGGRVIFTGSVIGERAMPGLAAYAAAKAGLTALVRTMALELGSRGITVNCVAPGWFDSPLADAWRTNGKREKAILDHTALGRWGTAADLPGAYLFLASDAAAFITGTVLAVDGGYLLP